MITLTKPDHDFALRCINSGKATEEEALFLSQMAVAYVANEPVSRTDYVYLQELTGGALSPSTPILRRA